MRQDWLFSVRYAPEGVRDFARRAVVGPASAATVEAALHLAEVPEDVRSGICSHQTVRDFVDGKLAFDSYGYYVPDPYPTGVSWLVCIGPVHAVIR